MEGHGAFFRSIESWISCVEIPRGRAKFPGESVPIDINGPEISELMELMELL
jgi:hypothetical protein